MVWSYSRFATYEDCPYRFYLTYIHKTEAVKLFFADYGLFMHLIIQKYLTGALQKEELPGYYLTHFRKNVSGKAPNQTVFQNYFRQGLAYLNDIEPAKEEILGIEKEVFFNIEDREFIGYIDKVSQNNGIEITDHKSRALKERTHRKKPTRSDEELDRYLRQLYIYSIPIEKEYGDLPKNLIFNCFRIKTQVIEPFDMNAYEATKRWALATISSIAGETAWKPHIDWFKCSYLCGCNHQCEYFQMFGGAA